MPVLQTKLEVGAPNDRFELEADRMADRVMRMADPRRTAPINLDGEAAPDGIQRLCADCEEEVRRRPIEEEEEDLQMQPRSGATPAIGPGLQAQIGGLRGGGRPLSAAERAFFEPRFGHDFGQVRVHTDARAMALAHALDARAFTVGGDIVLGAGQYALGSEVGQKLLAHELAHTIQQDDDRIVRRLTISPIVNKINPNWTCGKFMRHWKFELSNGAPAEGYMVQQIDYSLDLEGCPNSGLGKGRQEDKFWEAWRHNSGDKLDAKYINYTDKSETPSMPDRIGSRRSSGIVKFFLKTVTGDLDALWSTTAVPMSAGLPALKGPTPPAWWNDPPVEGPAQRVAGQDWQCCGLANDFYKPFASP